MSVRPTLKSDRAVAAALAAIGPCDERTAAVLLFIASARHLDRILNDRETAGELAYQMADELATRSK